jgi:hypothetical protein
MVKLYQTVPTKTDSAANHLTVRCLDMDRMPHVANLALLQWRVVDVAGQCGLITIAGRTRQTSSDKSATASNADRYRALLKNRKI